MFNRLLHRCYQVQRCTSGYQRCDGILGCQMAKIPKVLCILIRGQVIPFHPIIIQGIIQQIPCPHPAIHCLVIPHILHPKGTYLALSVNSAHSRTYQLSRGVQCQTRTIVPIQTHRVQHHIHLPLKRREPLVRVYGKTPGAQICQVFMMPSISGREDVGTLEQCEFNRCQSTRSVTTNDENVGTSERSVQLSCQIQRLACRNIRRTQTQCHDAIDLVRNTDDALILDGNILGITPRGHDCGNLVAYLECRIIGSLLAHFVNGTHKVGTGDEGQFLHFIPFSATDHAVLEGDSGTVDLDDDFVRFAWLGDVGYLLKQQLLDIAMFRNLHNQLMILINGLELLHLLHKVGMP
mmetsp:Transcript_7355/g.16668  ORF Transcript_7355/g.16668 Transcript_7355/m.16668 type:complete len:350 (+) Transcript_7355:365-1414(+)